MIETCCRCNLSFRLKGKGKGRRRGKEKEGEKVSLTPMLYRTCSAPYDLREVPPQY